MWFGYKKEVAFFNSLIYVEGHKEVFIIMLLIRSHNLNDETLQAPPPPHFSHWSPFLRSPCLAISWGSVFYSSCSKRHAVKRHRQATTGLSIPSRIFLFCPSHFTWKIHVNFLLLFPLLRFVKLRNG